MKNILLICAVLLSICSYAQLANWTPVPGGTNFPTNNSGQIHGFCRISQMKFHASDTNKYYAVTGEGGLFFSNDQGANWTVAPGTDVLTNNCASICIDYTNDQHLLLGTGDANYYSNSSAGLRKSTDGGATFTATSLTNCLVIEIIQNSTNSLEYIAATSKGIYKSTDGGNNWSAVTATNIPFTDMKVNTATNSQIVYACTEEDVPRFYRSTNFGTNWTQITSGVIASTANIQSGSRIGVTPANPNIVYLSVVGGGGIILKSIDGGLNFTTQKAEGSPYITFYDDDVTEGGQGNYNHTITVDLLDPSKLWLQAHCTWYSTNSGVTWTLLTHWWEKCHTDMHQITQAPFNRNKLYSMNDGGVWLSVDGGNVWTPKSDGLYAYEIGNKCGIGSQVDKNFISIGTQDNGRVIADATGWFTTGGGDDYDKRQCDYNGNIYFDGTDRQLNHTGPTGGYGLPTTNWNAFGFNRTNVNLGFVGVTNVYRTTDLSAGTPTWTQISTFNQTIVDIHSSIADPNRLYVLVSNGDIYVSSNALAASPTFVLRTPPGSATSLGSVAAIANNADIVYVSENNTVYRSADAGVTWTNVTYNLPNVNHRRILAEQFGGTEELVFIATNNAVYYKKAGAVTWTNYSTNLPSRRSPTEFSMYDDGTNQARIRYASFGRAIWESPFDNLRPFAANIVVGDSAIDCDNSSVLYTQACVGTNNTPITYSWSFSGGTPATSTAASVNVTYPSTGTYNVTLTATDALNNTSSKTIAVFVQVNTELALPLTEGFVSAAFPPLGWNQVNVANVSELWERNAVVGSQGSTESMQYRNYDHYNGNHDEMRSSTYNFTGISSATLTFDVAFRRYSGANSDSLAVLVSTDCGASFTTVYYKGGNNLSTVPGDYTPDGFVPTPSQWRTETIDLSPYIGNQNVMISFQNRGHYGQNIYVDNINLTGVIATPGPNFGAAPSAVCTGENVTVTDASIGAVTSWDWDFGPGATPATATGIGPHTVSYSSAGTKSITLTVNGGGTSTHDVTVTGTPSVPSITAGGPTTFCSGNSVTLTSSAATGNTWSNGETTPSITVSTAGTYTVTASNGSCTSAASTGTTVVINPNPNVTFAAIANLCLDDAAFALTQGAPSGGTYSGIGVSGGQFNPAIAGAGVATLTYLVTDGNGCSGTASIDVQVDDCMGIKESELSFVSIYPNPSNGLFTVDAGKLTIDHVIIYDSKGRVVREMKDSKNTTLKINISDMANGAYTVKVIAADAWQIVPIVVER
ncbi:PKD domain-containing protein [Fluviicola taffensis]|uniref:PKD domain-containing protein n=1 Tax=Fluviicola taffensis TaxID=191579 RepID=UPI003137C5B9